MGWEKSENGFLAMNDFSKVFSYIGEHCAIN